MVSEGCWGKAGATAAVTKERFLNKFQLSEEWHMPWEEKNRLETYYPRVREALPDFTVSGFLAIPLSLSICLVSLW